MSKEEKDKLPCVYGTQICKDCLARHEIRKAFNKPHLSKWVLKKSIEDRIIQKFADAFAERLSDEFSALSDFCDSCPFREVFVEKLRKKVN